jgi:hypothetical protein
MKFILSAGFRASAKEACCKQYVSLGAREMGNAGRHKSTATAGVVIRCPFSAAVYVSDAHNAG